MACLSDRYDLTTAIFVMLHSLGGSWIAVSLYSRSIVLDLASMVDSLGKCDTDRI